MRSVCTVQVESCPLCTVLLCCGVLCTLLDHAHTPHTGRGCCWPDCSAAAHPNFNIFPFVVVNGWAADTASRGTALLIRTNLVKTTLSSNTLSKSLIIISSACNIGNLGQFVEQRATKMNIFFKLPIFSVITTFSMCCMVGLVGLDQVSEMKYSELYLHAGSADCSGARQCSDHPRDRRVRVLF